MNQVQQILHDAGMPTTTVTLDFETYHDDEYCLKNMPTAEYIRDERFEFLSVSFKQSGYDTRFSTDVPDTLGRMRERFGDNLERCTLCVQNHRFEMLVFKYIVGFEPKYVIDTMDLAGYVDPMAPRGLAAIAPRYGCGEKGTALADVKGMHLDEIRRKGLLEGLREYNAQDVNLQDALLHKLLPRLTNPTQELYLMRHTMGLFLNPVLYVDRERAIKFMETLSEMKTRNIPEGYEEDNFKDLAFARIMKGFLGDDLPTKPGKPTKNMIPITGADNLIPAFAKTDKGMVFILKHENELVRQLAQAKQDRQSFPAHIKRVQRIVTESDCRDGTIGIPLKYYGAHTGRVAGTGGINFLNFSGEDFMQEIKECMTPPPGYKFVVYDSAAIEARGVAWLARQDDLVQAFADGADVYCSLAQSITGMYTRKPRPADPPKIAAGYDIRRTLGKVGILGNGYGMGEERALEQAWAKNPSLRPLIDSGQIDLNLMRKIKETYRSDYSMIPKLWNKLENAMRWVILRDDFADVNDRIRFERDPHEAGAVLMRLPSGRCMRYPRARISSGTGGIVWRPEGSTKDYHLWGGSLTENAVQALCRDIVMDQLKMVEDAGYPVIHHIYDSLVVLCEGGDEEACEEVVYDIMRTSSDWCLDLPLDAEGGTYNCFK